MREKLGRRRHSRWGKIRRSTTDENQPLWPTARAVVVRGSLVSSGPVVSRVSELCVLFLFLLLYIINCTQLLSRGLQDSRAVSQLHRERPGNVPVKKAASLALARDARKIRRVRVPYITIYTRSSTHIDIYKCSLYVILRILRTDSLCCVAICASHTFRIFGTCFYPVSQLSHIIICNLCGTRPWCKSCHRDCSPSSMRRIGLRRTGRNESIKNPQFRRSHLRISTRFDFHENFCINFVFEFFFYLRQ